MDFWLCTVAVVLVSLLAVPAWQDHRIREEVSACMAQLEPVRQQVEQNQRLRRAWPDQIRLDPVAPFLVSQTCDGFTGYDPSDGSFMVNLNEAAVAAGLPTLQPQLTPVLRGAGVHWQCTRGHTRPAQLKYLPADCRGLPL